MASRIQRDAFKVLGVDLADFDFTDWSYGEIPYTHTAQWSELYVYMRRWAWQMIDRDRERALRVARDEPPLAWDNDFDAREDMVYDRLTAAFSCATEAARDWMDEMRRLGESFPWDDAPRDEQ
jgi:hypothetical protein